MEPSYGESNHDHHYSRNSDGAYIWVIILIVIIVIIIIITVVYSYGYNKPKIMSPGFHHRSPAYVLSSNDKNYDYKYQNDTTSLSTVKCFELCGGSNQIYRVNFPKKNECSTKYLVLVTLHLSESYLCNTDDHSYLTRQNSVINEHFQFDSQSEPKITPPFIKRRTMSNRTEIIFYQDGDNLDVEFLVSDETELVSTMKVELCSVRHGKLNGDGFCIKIHKKDSQGSDLEYDYHQDSNQSKSSDNQSSIPYYKSDRSNISDQTSHRSHGSHKSDRSHSSDHSSDHSSGSSLYHSDRSNMSDNPSGHQSD